MSLFKRISLASAAGLFLSAGVVAGSPETESTPAVQPSAAQESRIKAEFSQLDVDKNGQLTPQEAEKDLFLKERFARYDVNQDKLLTQSEYRPFALAQLDPVDMDDEEEEAE